MGSHRKSIFDSFWTGTALFCLIQINIILTSELKVKNQVNFGATVLPPIAFAGGVTSDPNKSDGIPINTEVETTLDDLAGKFTPDQNQKFQRVATTEQDKREIDVNKKREDFSTFASFLVEIIVFFVFLAILLSFITICARKCGGNPSNNGRIYGPGPINGSLVTDPETHEYEPVTGLSHTFGATCQFPARTSNFTGDLNHQFVQNDAQRYSSVVSEYSDYHSEAEDRAKSKRSRKKKIPGPTF